MFLQSRVGITKWDKHYYKHGYYINVNLNSRIPGHSKTLKDIFLFCSSTTEKKIQELFQDIEVKSSNIIEVLGPKSIRS